MDASAALILLLAMLIGFAFGLHTPGGRRFQLLPVLLAVAATWLALQIVLWIDWSLRSTFRLSVILGLTIWSLPFHILLVLPAAGACALSQCTHRRAGEGGIMSMLRGFGIILASAFGLGLAGALIGYALGKVAPGYYRAVFSNGNDPNFDPVAVGLGLGVTQGMTAGLVIGAIIVLAVAWYRSRSTLGRASRESITPADSRRAP